MEIFIPCIPKGKGRPRFSRKTGHAYTPTSTRTAEIDIASFVRSQIKGAPLEGALRIDVEILVPIPQTWSAKKRIAAAACQIWPATRPDLSNQIKLLEDSLNGILWHDDSQIVQTFITKRYSDTPGYELSVSRPIYSRVIPLAQQD